MSTWRSSMQWPALAVAPCDSYGRTIPLNWVSRYLVELGRFDEADKTSRELLVMSREHQLDLQAAFALDLLACVAISHPQEAAESALRSFESAGRVLGFVNVRLEALQATRDFIEQPQYERALAVLRETLGADALANLMAEGAAMTQEQAIETALAL